MFGLTRSGLESTMYHTRYEHANHYTTKAVVTCWVLQEGRVKDDACLCHACVNGGLGLSFLVITITSREFCRFLFCNLVI